MRQQPLVPRRTVRPNQNGGVDNGTFGDGENMLTREVGPTWVGWVGHDDGSRLTINQRLEVGQVNLPPLLCLNEVRRHECGVSRWHLHSGPTIKTERARLENSIESACR